MGEDKGVAAPGKPGDGSGRIATRRKDLTMKVIELAFTGYPVTDLKRAREFYEGFLGLRETRRFGDDRAAWIEYDVGPGTLAITNLAEGWKPSAGGGCVGLEVEDFEGAMRAVRDRGVSVTQGPFETPVCHMVVVLDPDGNSITLHRRKS
jgi:predicted enzyme related to lactoylglutathione lyase